MRNETTRSIAVAICVAGILFLGGCHKHVASTPVAQATIPTTPVGPIVRLQASPSTIMKGGSSVLTWSSSNANQLVLYPGNGSVAAEGSLKVSPSDSITYTLRARGPGGSTSASTSIEVTQPSMGSGIVSGPVVDQSFAGNAQDAFFDFNKADIRPDAREALSHDAVYLRAHPEMMITIEGHCDDRGGEEYNLALGDRRAEEARKYLVSEGISLDRIQTVSLGKEHPFCTTDDEACWQKNRRGHLVKK